MRTTNKLAVVINVLILILYTLVFLAAGFFLTFATSLVIFQGFDVNNIVDNIWARVVGIALMALAVVFVAVQVLKGKREQCISFESPDGEIVIAISAIEDFIRRLGKSFHEIRELTPTIRAINEGVDVEMKLVLWDDENVHTAVDKIKSTIRDQVQNFFGIANVHSVKIFVTKTVAREKLTESKIVSEPKIGDSEEDRVSDE